MGEAWFWSWEHMAMVLVGSGLHTILTSSCRNKMEIDDYLAIWRSAFTFIT